MQQSHPNSDASDNQLIRPVGYTPTAEQRSRQLPLKPWQIVLLALAGFIGLVLWFLFTAKSVRLDFDPPAQTLDISGGLSIELGGIYLMREGEFRIQANAPGYYPLEQSLFVGEARSQDIAFEFAPLPGRVTLTSQPAGASVSLLTTDAKAGDEDNHTPLGTTPTEPVQLAAGPQTLRFSKTRYQSSVLQVEVEGRDREQEITAELVPNWADVSLTSEPSGAAIFVDDVETGQVTPATVEVPAGEHEIRIKAPGHKSFRQRILVAPLEQVALPTAKLVQADGLLAVSSTPAGAGVTLNGQFQGETPLELSVKSSTPYRLQIYKAGFARQERSVSVASGEERAVRFNLNRLTGQLVVVADPADAELFVNGSPRGYANQTLTLPTFNQRIEIRADGYAGYATQITPRNGMTQELKVRLLTLEEARLAALTPQITSAQGQELVLLSPKPFTMGASRREPGRRANETIREVSMGRLFYLGRHEVTNLQFKAFAAGHDSGQFEDRALNEDDQPVVNVSWEEAALYCNWLSKQDNLPPFYRADLGKVVGIVPSSTGYRLPTEAEWAWAIRQNGGEPTRFPWGGNLPPPDRHGNYADRSASHLVGRVIFGYNDNHIGAAPVGTYPPSAIGIYDLSGNVAEWTNDFYEIPNGEPVNDPLGPSSGDYHTIRGSGWMNGTISDLRVSFRDYGIGGRQDVGFRIARFAEPS